MRIIVFTDTHANLPALIALKKSTAKEGYDAAFHTGDVLDIGPYPAECLEVMAEIPRLNQLMGNHEEFFVNGIPEPRPAWMSKEEELHYRWTSSRLQPAARDAISRWPYFLCREFENTSVAFAHYGLAKTGGEFIPVVANPSISDFDEMFARFGTHIVFYGHDHKQADVQGKARYVNPGPLGCGPEPLARYCVATFARRGCMLEHRAVPYDRSNLFAEFERRQVPAREFIMNAFYGR